MLVPMTGLLHFSTCSVEIRLLPLYICLHSMCSTTCKFGHLFVGCSLINVSGCCRAVNRTACVHICLLADFSSAFCPSSRPLGLSPLLFCVPAFFVYLTFFFFSNSDSVNQ